MACGYTPDLLRLLETLGDEKQKLAAQAQAELQQTTQQLDAAKKRSASATGSARDTGDWTAVYNKWDAWQDPEELAQREQQAREKQERASKATAAAGCNHDHSAEQQLMDMTTRSKLDACDQFRLLGNRFFEQGQYQRAAYHYHKALVYFEYIFPETEPDDHEMEQLKLKTLLNFAACRIKTGHLDDAIHHADLALQIDGQSVKALFRRAQAHRMRDEFDKATADLTAAMEYSKPESDPLLVQEKQLLQAKMLAYRLKNKQLSKAMFGGPAATTTDTNRADFRGTVSMVRDVPLQLSTTSIVGKDATKAVDWSLDATWRPCAAGMAELHDLLESL